VHVAKDASADLIVMGLHAGRGAMGRMLFGSTTQHVLRHARCPVLTVTTPLATVPGEKTSAAADAARK